MSALAPHVHAAVLGKDLVLLDGRSDRYLAIPGSLVTLMEDSAAVDLGPGLLLAGKAAAALDRAGLLRTCGRPWSPLPPPGRALTPAVGQPLSASDWCSLVVALTSAGRRLRSGRSLGATSFTSRRAPPDPAEEDSLADAVGRLSKLRLLVPTPRRCLPSALVARSFLELEGLSVDIVAGVRSHPFGAHCWLEAGGMVIDDDLDRVSAYTPIVVAPR